MAQDIVQYQMSDIEKMAKAVAASNLFGIKTFDQAMALMLIASAEGRHPVEAARDYNIISGRPAKTADAMLRDFLHSGGKVEWHSLSDEKADATFTHPQGGTVKIDWDMARAKKAGLGVKDMWVKYPRQMLRSRVISEGVRTVCPAATSGMYVPEEAQEFENKGEAMKNVTPAAVQEIFDSAKERSVDVELEELKQKAKDAALQGNAALTKFLQKISKPDRSKLIPFGTEFRKMAQEVEANNPEAFGDQLPPNMQEEILPVIMKPE